MKSIKNFEDVKARFSDWQAWDYLIWDAGQGPVEMPAPGYDHDLGDGPLYLSEAGMFEASPKQLAAHFGWTEAKATHFLSRLFDREMIERTDLVCSDGSPVVRIIDFPNPPVPADYCEWEA